MCSCSLTWWPTRCWQPSGKGLSRDVCWPLAKAEQSTLHALSLRMYLVKMTFPIPGPSKASHRKTKPRCALVPFKIVSHRYACRCFPPLQFSLLAEESSLQHNPVPLLGGKSLCSRERETCPISTVSTQNQGPTVACLMVAMWYLRKVGFLKKYLLIYSYITF